MGPEIWLYIAYLVLQKSFFQTLFIDQCKLKLSSLGTYLVVSWAAGHELLHAAVAFNFFGGGMMDVGCSSADWNEVPTSSSACG